MSTKSKRKADSPTARLTRAYEAAYRYFRDKLFIPTLGEALPEPVLTFSRCSRKKAVSFFSRETWKPETDPSHRVSEIALVPEHTSRDPRELMSHLVREMAHFADYLAGTATPEGITAVAGSNAWPNSAFRQSPPPPRVESPSSTKSTPTAPLREPMRLCPLMCCFLSPAPPPSLAKTQSKRRSTRALKDMIGRKNRACTASGKDTNARHAIPRCEALPVAA